ncbi:MAG: hypothetical protein BGO29_07120 [Bacteroidales bacterium 36-12]|nr:MAG: hypothetical protein BGO29_07120 [Bacteroidales bacterium 36-12]
MKKIVYIFVIAIITLISCDKNELYVQELTLNEVELDNQHATKRQIILGEKLNNPYSLSNMLAALDTLKSYPEQHSSSMKAPSSTLDNIVIEPTDLYVRFLPSDSLEFVKLMTDTSLILFDYPLDYQKLQTGDYYMDPSVSGKYTWLYTSVPIDFILPDGIYYEVLEELFIPEHSPYYSQVETPDYVKGVNKTRSSAENSFYITDALRTIEAISFIITGNSELLNKPDKASSSGMQKAKSYVTKRFLFTSWVEAVYNPEGYIKIATSVGTLPVPNIRVRVARYFTAYETRTDANGRFYFSAQFGQDAVFPNIEYFVFFDGQNGSNYWRLCDYISPSIPLWTTGISLGVHSPDTYSYTFTTSNYFWGECVQHCAINNYINTARNDAIALPAQHLDIISIKSSDYTKYDPVFKNKITGKGNPDLVLRYQNSLDDYKKISALTWHKLTNASQISRMLGIQGSGWTSNYWNALQNQLLEDDKDDLNDCFCITYKSSGDCSQQIALTEGWANFRLGELYRRNYGTSGYTLTQNPHLKQYVDMFRNLYNIGCSYQNLEKSLIATTISGFKYNLTSYYPGLAQQISSIIPTIEQSLPGKVTFMTYNLYRNLTNDAQFGRIPKFSRVIESCNADVVAIQEIRGLTNFAELKRKTQLNGERYNTLLFYGIGMLWKPTLGTPKVKIFEIKPSNNSIDTEDRAFMVAEFADFYFISTHYSIDGTEQLKMSDQIVNYVNSTSKPVFLAGDFNATVNESPIIRLTNNNFYILNDLTQNTYPSSNPRKQIDLVIEYNNGHRPSNVLKRGMPIFQREDFRNLSDHLPYFVTVDLHNY